MVRIRRKARGRGFTLIEVLIVIAIIVALGGLVAVNLLGKKKDAKIGLAKTDLNTLRLALKGFNLKYDRFPTDDEGLEVLWNKEKLDADADQSKWSKELESSMPNDQWGKPWGYRQTSEHGDEENFDLWSNGPDGEEGTEDDITSWPKEDADGSPSDSTPTNSGSTGGGG